MRPPAHDLYRGYDTGPGNVRTVEVTLYCQNPKCAHSRRPYPVKGIASLGSWWEPPDCGPTECPECDSELDTTPLFEGDEPYVSQEWE